MGNDVDDKRYILKSNVNSILLPIKNLVKLS